MIMETACHIIPTWLIAFFVLALICLSILGRRRSYTYYRPAPAVS